MSTFIIRSNLLSAFRVIRRLHGYQFNNNLLLHSAKPALFQHSSNFQTSAICHGLMEFFEDPSQWGEQEIKSGRAWTVDDLRIKSNTDLHKLWYVLLKERNMLLTMEQAAKDQVELFPSPERIDKVEISMENIETVVRERDKAYHDLETGETGERPHDYKEDEFGRWNIVPLEEHLIPMRENKKYLEEDLFPTMETVNPTLKEFHLRLREKERLQKRFELRKQKNYIFKLLKKFPDTDMEALKQKYPEINIERLKEMLN